MPVSVGCWEAKTARKKRKEKEEKNKKKRKCYWLRRPVACDNRDSAAPPIAAMPVGKGGRGAEGGRIQLEVCGSAKNGQHAVLLSNGGGFSFIFLVPARGREG